jgi:hypothetical protein
MANLRRDEIARLSDGEYWARSRCEAVVSVNRQIEIHNRLGGGEETELRKDRDQRGRHPSHEIEFDISETITECEKSEYHGIETNMRGR